ncbi:MAG TPA: hypothetical protein VGI31_08690 [Streptosporangiaceae bacterium]|jgi:hypothetical protein
MQGRHERRENQQDDRQPSQPPDSAPDQDRAAAEHEAQVNQHKHEPLPASHHADSAEPEPARHAEHAPDLHEPGQAVRDMMGGPQPQGDVPDAPATQIAATQGEEDQAVRVRHVANAVPGKPDGEVDTRP